MTSFSTSLYFTSSYCGHLQNPNSLPREGYIRQDGRNAKYTALIQYKLWDCHIYRQAECNKVSKKWGPVKCVLTYADAFQLIADVHESLLHLGSYTPFTS